MLLAERPTRRLEGAPAALQGQGLAPEGVVDDRLGLFCDPLVHCDRLRWLGDLGGGHGLALDRLKF